MELKQETQLVTQVRLSKGEPEKSKKIKGELIKGEKRWIQTQPECKRKSFKGLINCGYDMPF